MIVLSDGEGVQSNTLKAMIAFGDLPHVDVAIHSDTTFERSQTYLYREKMLPFWELHGIKCIAVMPTSTLNIESENRKTQSVIIPAFTSTPSAKGGQLRRQCTQRWKIAPMCRWLQANRNGEQVEMWIGISLDESLRMRTSDVKYIVNRYPLVEKRMTRADCVKYLQAHQIKVPVKSSCVFCPFHNKAAWKELYQTNNGDWEKAVIVDNAIRKIRPPYDLFVHSSRKPLEKIAESIDAQAEFNFESEECYGVCFI
jgi:hypothetical protein